MSNFGLNDAANRNGVPGTTISVVDIARGIVVREIQLPGDLKAPHGLSFWPRHGDDLFTNAEMGDVMVVYGAATGKVKRRFALPADVHSFVFSKDGTALILSSPKGRLYRADPVTGKVEATCELGSSVRGLAWTNDGRQLIASLTGEIAIVDAGDLSVKQRIPVAGATQIFYSAESPDGRYYLAPSIFDGEVRVMDVKDGSVLKHIHTGTPLRVMISPDPRFAYVSNVTPTGDHLTVIDLRTLETLDIGGVQDVNGVAFSAVLPGLKK